MGAGRCECKDQERKSSEGKLKAPWVCIESSPEEKWTGLVHTVGKGSSRFLVDALSCMTGLVTEKAMPASASQFSTARGSGPQEGHAQVTKTGHLLSRHSNVMEEHELTNTQRNTG